MSVPIPLAVRVVTSRQDIHITNRLSDFSFRTVVPGGFASARFTLNAPLRFEPDELAHFARVYVYDARNGNTVWEGRLEDPGRSVGSNGEEFEVAALGPSVHAKDRVAPVVYVDTRLSEFITADGSGGAYSIARREASTADTGALRISCGRGNIVTQLSLGAAVYNSIYAAGQDVALVWVPWDVGFTSVNSDVELRTAQDYGPTTTVIIEDFNTAGGTLSASIGGATAITAGHNRVFLISRRSGADVNPVNDETYWADFTQMAIMGTRVDKTGAAVTSYAGVTVTTQQVVEDVLGRLLPLYDGANAAVGTSTWGLGQLVYPDGATAEKILADMMEAEGDYLWEALDTNPATGKHRFTWRQWPTSVRYEASAEDGYSSTGSAAELFNAVLVRYRDDRNQVRTVRRTQAVPALDDAGIVREQFLDLGDEAGSALGAAENAGDNFLAEHRYAPAAARLTIARPILDTVTGRMVMPWEIRPGYLIRVRDFNPRPAVLDATGRDGASVFKIVSVDYSASDACAQLELDTPTPTTARRISDVISVRPPQLGPIRRR